MTFLLAFIITFLVATNIWLLVFHRRKVVVIQTPEQTTGR